MQIRNSKTGYGVVFWALHWTSATLFVLVAIVAASISSAEDAALREGFVGRHVSLGIALLAVMVARLVWRLSNPNPVWSYRVPVGRQRVAVAVHWLIHTIVLIESLTGLVLIGAFALPQMSPDSSPESSPEWLSAAGLHAVLPNLIYLLILAHILAAAMHQIGALASGNAGEPAAGGGDAAAPSPTQNEDNPSRRTDGPA